MKQFEKLIYFNICIIFQALNSGTAPLVGFKAEFFTTNHTLYNASAPPTLPKRPMTAYFLFAQEERPKVAKSYPSAELGQIAKELGKRYKSLSEGQKQPYVELSQKNLASYKQEMDALKKTEEGKILLEGSRTEKIEKKMKKAKAKIVKIKKTTNYPKKTLAYGEFLKDYIAKTTNPDLKITERFSQAVLAWKNLSEPNKQKYKNKAETDNNNLSQRIGTWETANPDAVMELKDLKEQLAKLRKILNPPEPKMKEVKKPKVVKKVAKKPKKVVKKA